ncbi:alpha-amylase family glycosyl hydrolase [Echinicola shivajiensis]|uniref:alpha-amylase family glycosyl hydrolase n=1 Tax=Echinicola shivajiensis TaxID=1035916 RepID=UPI001BFC1E68|nr:alpha-amylase family glycosyl hydrolase [Echinicola shivajiensis]
MKDFHLKNALLVLVMACIPVLVWGQVSTKPSFPRADEKVRIIYDASSEVSELQGEEEVCIHIGAITESENSNFWSVVPFEWGSSDPAAKMSRVEGEDDLWFFELVPNEFFERANDETIFRLGLVFRNADGTKEGKSESNEDFFINLAQGFDISFKEPTGERVFLKQREELAIEIQASSNARISLELNGLEVAFENEGSSLAYSFVSDEPGEFLFVGKGEKVGLEVSKSLSVNVFADSEVKELPNGLRKGINYLSETKVALVLEAPRKDNVFVIGDFNDWKVLPAFQMNITAAGEIFWLELDDLEPNKEYMFQYLVNGKTKIADPYAEKIADPFHDQEIIDLGKYPGLKLYPEGQEFQASYLQTAQEKYDWKYNNYEKPLAEELVVYELLVRDFDERRSYNAVTERLDYLQSLGINALELMPVMEFEGNLSWGYNPSFFFAPDKYYGTRDELKRLVDEAHKRGMVVIMDMVLNHAFGQSPFVRLYNEGDYGAPTVENPWLNTTATHPFNVGYDFNHESKYTQDLVDSVNHYWMSEYHIDGFRFDLSKGFTQQDAGNDVAKWSQLDESRIEIWKRIYDQIRSHHPDAYVILEHLAENAEEKILADYAMILWGNMNHSFRQMAKGESLDFSYSYYKTRGWEKNHLISYMESHDEERLMWETLSFGERSPLDLRGLENAVDRNQLLTAFYFGLPGPKMIWQFGEMGYDVELDNDRLGVKPPHWGYLENEERLRLYYLYKAMIKLKQEYAVFNYPKEVSLDLANAVKVISLVGEDLDVVLIGNFGLQEVKQKSVDFPYSGTWYEYISGEEIEVVGDSRILDLEANEFLVFTNKKLPKPEVEIRSLDLITALPEEGRKFDEIKLFPVPVSGTLNVELPEKIGEFIYRIIDMSGKVWFEGTNY